jgi:serine/threonine protein kinase
MNPTSFEAPALEVMNALLPAFEFKTLITANPYRAVYLATQKSLERDVAIKVLAPQLGGNPEALNAFEETARSMARLNHPNLISIYDSGEINGMPYFVMEFVPGKSLSRSSAGKPVEISQTLRLIDGICAGLAHAHAHGIAHGSLNPTNILLNQQAEPKIGNFGIDDTDQPLKESAVGIHMESYIAPEIAGHPHHASHAADIFAIGAILYELITGKPHSKDAPSPSELTKCPTELDAIWKRATASLPADRFPDLASMRKEIQAFLTKKRNPLAAPPKARLQSEPPARPQAAASSPEAPPPASIKNHPGINWKLIRNLFIIAGLLFAISIAWDNLQTKKKQRDKELQQQTAQQEAKEKEAIEAARLKALERARLAETPKRPTPTPEPEPEPEPVPETPEQSLARLRLALAGGDRSEMPVGTIRRGDCDYFLVKESMTWPDAAWFAETHGAHLAIPNATADLSWLVKNVAIDEAIWIGAGRSGRRDWVLADGTLWKPSREPSGVGSYVGADKHGFLRAAGPGAKVPFILQWHRDGSNPAALEKFFEITRATLTSGSPIFPPGTRNFEDRHFLHVARPIAWRDAVDFAEKSGGHLVVASNVAEISALEEMTRDLTSPNGIWLGAFFRESQWLWITGEPWKATRWATNASTEQPDSALIIEPKSGWNSRNLSSPADGFIIEWSNDRKSRPANQEPNPQPTPPASSHNSQSSALSSRAAGLVLAADRKRTQQLTDNARKYQWDLDTFLRGLNRSEQNAWSPHVTNLKESIRGNRVPSSVPASSGIKLSEKMASIAEYGARKQNEIDTGFRAEVEKIHSAFVTKIRDEIRTAEQASDQALAQSLKDELAAAIDPDSWVKSLGIHSDSGSPEASNAQGSSPPVDPPNTRTPLVD